MRPRIWFVIGFLLVFIGMLLFVHMYVMLPSGQGLVKCPLWRYYGSELYNAATPHPVGPAAGNGSGLGKTLFFHVLFSVLGGLLFAGAAKAADKRKSK
jgi:hypothetical protein